MISFIFYGLPNLSEILAIFALTEVVRRQFLTFTSFNINLRHKVQTKIFKKFSTMIGAMLSIWKNSNQKN